MGVLKSITAKLAAMPFVARAIAEQADLSAFRKRPDERILAGIAAIAFSYIIGWPLITALGFLSVYYHQAALVVIGGPSAYVLSHLVFLLGMYLAGFKYSRIFLRWLTRMGVLKLMRLCGSGPDEFAVENQAESHDGTPPAGLGVWAEHAGSDAAGRRTYEAERRAYEKEGMRDIM